MVDAIVGVVAALLMVVAIIFAIGFLDGRGWLDRIEDKVFWIADIGFKIGERRREVMPSWRGERDP